MERVLANINAIFELAERTKDPDVFDLPSEVVPNLPREGAGSTEGEEG
jgi:hypothetical protein